MQSPLVRLLTTRRFAPLFVTQFLGAFNDNLLKSALAIFVTFRLADAAGMPAATLVMIAGGLFIAPFFLFSGASGTLTVTTTNTRYTATGTITNTSYTVAPGRRLPAPVKSPSSTTSRSSCSPRYCSGSCGRACSPRRREPAAATR